MDIIDKWEEEIRIASSEYKKRDCGEKVYTNDRICRRAEFAIVNAYIDFLCLSKGSVIAGNHRRYVNKGDVQRKDEVKMILNYYGL